jgi:electron transport complex protein RnfD
MLLYGLGIGLLTFLLRRFGSGAEGTVYAVLVMNCLVPSIERLETAGWRGRKGLQHG